MAVIESTNAFHPVQNAPHTLAHALLVNSWHSISVFFDPTLLMYGFLDGLPIFTVGNCFNDLLVSLPEVFKFLIIQLGKRIETKSTFILPVIFLLVPGLFHLLRDRLFQLVPIQYAALLGGQHFLPAHSQHPFDTDDFQLVTEHSHEQINGRQFNHETVSADHFPITGHHMVRRFYRILRLVLGEKRHHCHIVVWIIADTFDSAFHRGDVGEYPIVPIRAVRLESFGVDFIEIGESVGEIVKDPPLVIRHVIHILRDFFKTPFCPQESGSIIDLHMLVCTHFVRVHAHSVKTYAILHHFILAVRIWSAVATLKGVYLIQNVWSCPFPSEIGHSHRIINLLSFDHDYLRFMFLTITGESCERHRKRAKGLNDQIGTLRHENVKAFIHDSHIIIDVLLHGFRVVFKMFRNVFIGHIIRLGSIQLVRLFADHSRHPYTSKTSDFQEIPEKDVAKLQLNQIGICPGGNHFKIIMPWEYNSP